jgi:hypothetical protein
VDRRLSSGSGAPGFDVVAVDFFILLFVLVQLLVLVVICFFIFLVVVVFVFEVVVISFGLREIVALDTPWPCQRGVKRARLPVDSVFCERP